MKPIFSTYTVVISQSHPPNSLYTRIRREKSSRLFIFCDPGAINSFIIWAKKNNKNKNTSLEGAGKFSNHETIHPSWSREPRVENVWVQFESMRRKSYSSWADEASMSLDLSDVALKRYLLYLFSFTPPQCVGVS